MMGWQWRQLDHICKSSAPRSREITTPVPHHSVFYRPDALPATQPTASEHSAILQLFTTIIQVNLYNVNLFAFSALTLLAGRQEGHPAGKN